MNAVINAPSQGVPPSQRLAVGQVGQWDTCQGSGRISGTPSGTASHKAMALLVLNKLKMGQAGQWDRLANLQRLSPGAGLYLR